LRGNAGTDSEVGLLIVLVLLLAIGPNLDNENILRS
jgi:hypothetical protein